MAARSDVPAAFGKSLYLKLAVVVLALGGAAFLAFRGGEEQNNAPNSAVPYVCLECNHVMQWTASDYDRALKAGRPAGSQEEPTRGQRLGLTCEKCNRPAVARAEKCPKDGTPVPIRTKDGSAPRCPKCNWSPSGA